MAQMVMVDGFWLFFWSLQVSYTESLLNMLILIIFSKEKTYFYSEPHIFIVTVRILTDYNYYHTVKKLYTIQ